MVALGLPLPDLGRKRPYAATQRRLCSSQLRPFIKLNDAATRLRYRISRSKFRLLRYRQRRKVAANLGFQKPDEFGLHKVVVVRYVETDHAPAPESRPEAPLQLTAVHLLHDEDHVGPPYQLGRERVVGVVVSARRVHLQVLPAREHLLGGGAAQPILAAHEQHRAIAGMPQP